MLKTQRLVTALRVLLGLAFAALAFAQLMVLPAMYEDWVPTSLEAATPRWPMLVVPGLGVLCVQAVIVCTWRLLTMVEEDRIFSDESLAWVNTIVGAMAAAWLLLLVLFCYVVIVGGLPGLPVALALMLVAEAVLGLLMVVMRALLRQAATLRADMEAVI